jgi:glucose-6-phosphate dehydrogenase assembly protein OpcA
MDDILERVNRVEAQISLIKNKVAYRDLRQMLSSVDKVVTEISKESVECRRMKKQTMKYTELTEQANQMLTNLEQHVTFAALLK